MSEAEILFGTGPRAAYTMLGVKQFLKGANMPKGPQGQKRPADTVANAIRVAKILTGEVEENMGDSGKDETAQVLRRKGGAANGAESKKGLERKKRKSVH